MSQVQAKLFADCYKQEFDETMKLFDQQTRNIEALEYKGCHLVPVIIPETVKYLCEEWEPKDDDIIIASAMRCGTHWLRDMLCGILYGRDDRLYEMTKQFTSPIQCLELGKKSKFKLLDNLYLPRRILFTHLTADVLPMEKFMTKKLKIFHIMRNPLDRLLSWYNLCMSMDFPCYNKDFDKFFEDYVTGQQPIMMKRGQTYADYILSWLPYREHENVKFLYFEDIKANPQKQIAEIAEFIEMPLTKDEVEDVIKKTTIAKVLENIEKEQSAEDAFRKVIKLIDKGNVATWKTNSLMTEEKSSRIRCLVESKLKGSGITFKYNATD